MEKNLQEESWDQVIEVPAIDPAAEKKARSRNRLIRCLYAAAAVVILALAVAVFFTDTLPGEENVQLISRHQSGVGMLSADAPASQTFRVEQNGLSAVDVMASNYNKKVKTGVLTLWLCDDTGAEIARHEVSVDSFKNNAFVTVPVPVQNGSAGRVYTLYAASDCVEQKGVTVRMGPVAATSTDLALTQPDGTVVYDNAMNLRMTYQTQTRGGMGAAALALVALCLIAVLPLGSRKERRRG